jgi:hypothetical protein
VSCPRPGLDGDPVIVGWAQQGVCHLRSAKSQPMFANLVGRQNSTTREMWQHTSQEVRSAKACMQPVLKNWLLVSNEGRRSVLTSEIPAG